MSGRNLFQWWQAAASSLLLALVLAGCSGSQDKPSSSVVDDVRGEPINSPITKPSTASETKAAQAGASQPSQGATQATSAISTNHAAEAIEKKDGDFLVVGFDKLASFTFEMPDESAGTNQVPTSWKSKDQIPASVKALNEKAIAIKGFMLPLKVEGGLVTEMLIMRDQSMCCYGTVPKINEWVSVKMLEKGVKAVMDQPVTVYGKLKVGEMRENGYLVGIYQLDGQKMANPADL